MKLERMLRSALRLPGRLAHAARVARDLAFWTLTFQLRAGLRRREHARLLRRSALFEVPFYLSQCPGDRAARADPYTHYLVTGARRGLDPSPLFDGTAYVARNPDAAGQNPLVHYLLSDLARAANVSEQRSAATLDREADPGEALLVAHPYRSAGDDASPRHVLVIGPTAPTEGDHVPELLRAAGEVGPVTFVSGDAARGDGAEAALRPSDAETLRGFAAALAHLADEGHRYAAVIACGFGQASRHLAPVRAYAAQAVLVCDATGPSATGAAAEEAGGEGARIARVAAACSDVVQVATPADRDAVLGLSPGARVEVIPRGAAGLAALISSARGAGPREGGRA